GAAAGSREGYNYSKAMKEAGKSGLVWTPETLDRYIRKPKEVVPGTKMPFPGLKDDAQRLDLIAYLQQFSKQPDK
ncbi:MAG: MFS transporter, partial [Alphaproteobacteria bacterium]